MESTVLHVEVFFSGRVQGVGFRYHTMQIAKEYEVSGYVRNLADGRVQLEAEGESDQVEAFLAAVMDQLSVFIRDTKRKDAYRNPEYSGFRIA